MNSSLIQQRNEARLELLLQYIGIKKYKKNEQGVYVAKLVIENDKLPLYFSVENNTVFIETPVLLDVEGSPESISKFKTSLLLSNSMNTIAIFALAPIEKRKLGLVIRGWRSFSGLDAEELTELILTIKKKKAEKTPVLISMAKRLGLKFTGGGNSLKDLLDKFFDF